VIDVLHRLCPVLDVLLFVSSCASLHHVPFDKTEKVLTGTFVAGEVVDTLQTWRFMGGDRFYEMNPLIATRHQLIHVKMGATGVVLCTAYYLPHRWRKYLLTFGNAVVWGTVIHNYRAGVRIFSW